MNSPRKELPCPAAGTGVHSWLLSQAHYCRLGGMDAYSTERYLIDRMSRPPNAAREVLDTIEKAFSQSNRSTPIPHSKSFQITKVPYDPSKLARLAKTIPIPKNWRHWLWERSPVRPDTINAYWFLKFLYLNGEKVLVFDEMKSPRPIATVEISDDMNTRVPEIIQRGGLKGHGIWFLSNPVDGLFHDTGMVDTHTNRKKFSCRSHHAITTFRYAVLESDVVPLNEWLAFITTRTFPVAAIYTSGSRSVHCLIRIDATSKDHWDSILAPFKAPFKVLGVDLGCLTAVRLTRLPGCHRPDKHGYQKLLYLNPHPTQTKLQDMPVISTRHNSLCRLKDLFPRWNPSQEAFL